MADIHMPLPPAALTIERVDAAFRKQGIWKACPTCGDARRSIMPADNITECLSIDVIEFWTAKPIIKFAAIGLVCVECGRTEMHDYVLLHRFVSKIELQA